MRLFRISSNSRLTSASRTFGSRGRRCSFSARTCRAAISSRSIGFVFSIEGFKSATKLRPTLGGSSSPDQQEHRPPRQIREGGCGHRRGGCQRRHRQGLQGRYRHMSPPTASKTTSIGRPSVRRRTQAAGSARTIGRCGSLQNLIFDATPSGSFSSNQRSAQTVRRISCLGSGNHKRRPSVFVFEWHSASTSDN